MKRADVVIVGGSAAGITAGVTCRRHYPGKTILLIRPEEKVLVPCAIPYIFGTIGSPDMNLIPDTILQNSDIEILLDEVTQIERTDRLVTTAKGKTIAYDKLVLATGSEPLTPKMPGIEMENVFAVRKDVAYLQHMLDRVNRSSSLVIVGGGFIGVEFADECRKNRDIRIKIVEMLPHCLMLNFDEQVCAVAEAIEKEHGIDILAPEKVEAVLGNGQVKAVKLASGRELEADMVILGIGCAANTKLAEEAGLALGSAKGIQVNRYMQTTDPNIFACGDCAEKFSFFNGQPSNLKLASIATTEARVAGANLFEPRRTNEGTVGVFSTVVGGTAFTLAGLSEREAADKGYDIVIGEAEAPNRHPGCMPGFADLKVKLLFEKSSSTLLGGQVFGGESAGELINVVSACIRNKMSADDMALFPMGTHPALTASPIIYHLVNAAEMAIDRLRSK